MMLFWICKSSTAFGQNDDIEEFIITQHDPNASPVMILAMSHPAITDMNELRKTGENYIRTIDPPRSVADVIITFGAEEKEIVVETDPYRLSRLRTYH
jgi:HAE1 family hydrophobic/amphiphilic exporter-1